MPEQLIETGNAAAAALSEATGSSIAVELITPGWGSSGYYGAPVLEAAARDKVFPAGTHMYLNHPSLTEQSDRPERDLRDLAAVLTEDASWNGTALVAPARVFAPYQPLVTEMKDHIGVSIRAAGDVQLGEAEGRKGRIVTALVESPGTSVDFVTHAGRGGRISQLLESARPTREHLAEARNVGQWVESAIHRDFTVMADDMAGQGQLTREERIALSSAIGDALAAFVASVEANAPQLYQRDLWDEPTAPAVSEGAPAPSTNDTPKEGLVPELTEAEVTALRDSAARAEAAERQLAESNARIAAMEARDTARPLIAAHLAEAQEPLPALAQARVVEAVLAAGIPTGEQGIDTTALSTAVEAAAAREASYLASVAPKPLVEAWGSFGGSGTEGARSAVAEADALTAYDAASARTFGRTIQGA